MAGITQETTTIKCNHCATPVLSIYNGSVIIINRHHGEKHYSFVKISTLLSYVFNENASGNNNGYVV